MIVAQLCLTLVTPWTAAHQAPLSMRFSRQGYWSGLSFPSPVQKGEANLRLPTSKAFTFLLLSELHSQAELTRFACGLQPPGGRKTSTFAVAAAGRAKEGGLEAPHSCPAYTSSKATPVLTPAGGFNHGVLSGESLGRLTPLLRQGFLSFMHLSLNKCKVILSAKWCRSLNSHTVLLFFPRGRGDPDCQQQHECAQSCPTLHDPLDYSLPGSSVRGVSQAGILVWVAISYSRGSSPPTAADLVYLTTKVDHF